ncbi:MAG: alpha/beta-type small acid-soluble spore protein [Firmicutes bacterium]|nr:alpha/beta-type small acid-soluble spore protein [Bacillota bacterium]
MPANNQSKSIGRNRVLVPGAEQVLEKYKYEIANEIGINNYNAIDKGELSSRQNGYIGGYMVRKMIQQAQNQMLQGAFQASQLAQQPSPKQPQGTTELL